MGEVKSVRSSGGEHCSYLIKGVNRSMDPSPRSCDTCGAANLAQAKFCSACGQAMSAATSSPPSAHTAAADSEPAPTALPVGTLLYTYRGHASHAPPLSVHAVAWSPDSRRIASADIDGTVQGWD